MSKMKWASFIPFGKRRKEVEPEQPTDLNYDVALTEAANTLVRVADIASKKNNVEALLQVANGWFQMARELEAPPSMNQERQPVGFTPPKDETHIPERPDPDVED